MRKVYVSVKTNLVIVLDEDVELYTVLSEMDCVSYTDGARISDCSIVDYEIQDSK
jgi:hypothetical protein